MLYLTSDNFPIFLPFGVIGFYRYFWFCIRLAASFAYRPIPLPQSPTYLADEDVTIIVPTIDAGDEFKDAARSWLVGNPKEILIITEEKMLGPLQDLANAVDPERIRVLTVPFANKRLQMSHGIKNTTTDIIVFADDDAIWPPTLLPYVLACFEDQKIGGVGTSQRVQPCGKEMTVWEVLAAFRLSIRNIEIACSTHIDGGLPCLSGRTAAYRTIILKDPEFLHGFTHDYWLGKYQLNSGDDKFLTRWMVSHGWSTYVQCCKETELLSTMKPNWRFLKQVLRWTRNTWRSDLRSLFMERHIWTAHPYVAYTMVDKLFNPFTLLAGPCLVASLVYKSTLPSEHGGYHLPWWNILLSYFTWLLATRTAKLLPHLWYRPQDVIYVPAFIVFGYYFAVMKLYALCTLHETGWGTRTGIGDIAAATAAMDKQDKQGTSNVNANVPYEGQSGHGVQSEVRNEKKSQFYGNDSHISNMAAPPAMRRRVLDDGQVYDYRGRGSGSSGTAIGSGSSGTAVASGSGSGTAHGQGYEYRLGGFMRSLRDPSGRGSGSERDVMEMESYPMRTE
ncbi:nucleotide-diphospho-sugar transferase [Rhodocollybia butyracea]|uniref:Nucleotide-diphospho-sugar transferase n=1 Tax=Rhodocollybia butyracea TaxID=206335 RepID=A0A9P5PL28_9AGAR|nr:nucleotide-diphospho-sugar transferase [Rhodocollybia butyracea]